MKFLTFFSNDSNSQIEANQHAPDSSVDCSPIVSNEAETPAAKIQTDPAIGSHHLEFCKTPIQPLTCDVNNEYKSRNFVLNWYKIFPWLERSVSTGRAYCHICRLFACRTGNVDHAFISTGFLDWKHARERFESHQNTDCHKKASISINFLVLKIVDVFLIN